MVDDAGERAGHFRSRHCVAARALLVNGSPAALGRPRLQSGNIRVLCGKASRKSNGAALRSGGLRPVGDPMVEGCMASAF